MASGPIVRIHGIKQKIPPGYVLGRVDSGGGQPQLIPLNTLGRRVLGAGLVFLPTSINNLQGVDLSTPATDGQVLTFDVGSGKFKAVSLPYWQMIECSDETTALTVATLRTFRMMKAIKLTKVKASLTTAQPSGSIFTVDVKKAGVSIFSTLLTIDNTEKTTATAATPAVLSTTSFADDDEMTIAVTQVGAAGAAGLKVYLIGTLA